MLKRDVTRRLSLLVAIMLLLAQPAYALVPQIEKSHWAYETMVMLAKDRVFAPMNLDWGLDKAISRQEFVRLVGKAYGSKAEASIEFADVSKDSPYYKDIAKAVGSGIISGYPDGSFKPNNSISRQEAATILSKLTRKENVLTSVVNRYSDGGKVPDWSRESLAWMIQKQYMSGYPDRSIGYDKAISYAESLTLIKNIMGVRVNTDLYEGDNKEVKGNVTVIRPNVTLSNMTIKGDLIIGGQVGEGDVTLDNVKVDGRLIVYGGGQNSIRLFNTVIRQLVVSRFDAPVRIVADRNTQVNDSVVETSSILEAPPTVSVFKTVVIQPQIVNMEIDLRGTFEDVSLKETTPVLNRNNASNGQLPEENVKINIPLGSVIRNLVVEQKAKIQGVGKIVKAALEANDVEINVKTDNLSFGSNVSKVKVNNKEFNSATEAKNATGGGTTTGGSTSSGSSSSSGGSSGGGSSVTLTPGTLAFTSTAATVTEGSDAVLGLTRTGGSDGSVSISYAVTTGTAVTADLGTPLTGTVTMQSGVASANITIPTIDDTSVENSEQFTVTLSNPTGGASLGTNSTATVTITDNDTAPSTSPGAIQFSQTSVSGTEGTSVTLTLTRTNGDSGSVSVDFTASNTSTSGSDYTLPSSQTVTFADGITSQSFQVGLVDDSSVENSEEFTLTLSNPTGGATLGTDSTATVTIVDNDTLSAGVIQFQSSSQTVNEGVTSDITLTRSSGTDGSVTVPYTVSVVSGGAIEGTDYNLPTTKSVTFASGQTSETISFEALTDNLTAVEGDEVIRLTLGAPSGGASLGTQTTTDITIGDQPTAFTLNSVTSASAITLNAVFSDHVVISTTSSSAISVVSGSGINVTSTGAITSNATTDTTVVITFDVTPTTGVAIVFTSAILSDEGVQLTQQTWAYNGSSWVKQ